MSIDEVSSSFGQNQSSYGQLDDYNRMKNYMNEQKYGGAFNVYNGLLLLNRNYNKFEVRRNQSDGI
ncbi:unnamed protein product [Debaryomyces tyrocola]|nr:unnamed protein product [Debaryomyces tyrocola]